MPSLREDPEVLIIRFPPSALLSLLSSSLQKPAALIWRLPPLPWMLPLCPSDTDQAQADLWRIRSSPCTSGVKGRWRHGRAQSHFCQHMQGFPLCGGGFPAVPPGAERRYFVSVAKDDDLVPAPH